MTYRRHCPTMKAFKMTGKCIAIPCGSWSCPNCAKVNARLWAWRVMLQLETDDRPAYFWTLTMASSYKTATDAYLKLPSLWDRLRKSIQRETGKWTYCAFIEGQRNRGGMPHFHIVGHTKSPIRLKDLAAHHGFGYQADEKLIESKQAGVYVSKYASKGDRFIPRNFRRVRPSQDWAKLPPVRRQQYIVQAKDETLTDYLIRVSELTGLSLDDISDEYLSVSWSVVEY